MIIIMTQLVTDQSSIVNLFFQQHRGTEILIKKKEREK